MGGKRSVRFRAAMRKNRTIGPRPDLAKFAGPAFVGAGRTSGHYLQPRLGNCRPTSDLGSNESAFEIKSRLFLSLVTSSRPPPTAAGGCDLLPVPPFPNGR